MKRFSYANVVATLALFLALGGGAVWAAGKIGSGDIKNNAIKSRHIAKGAVKTGDINAGAVAPDAARVGGVTVKPLKVAMQDGGSDVTLAQIGSATVKLACGGGAAGITASTADNSAPTVYAEYRHSTDKVTSAVLYGGPAAWASATVGQSAYVSIRQSNNTVTRLDFDAWFSANEIGTNDCFAQGTIETF